MQLALTGRIDCAATQDNHVPDLPRSAMGGIRVRHRRIDRRLVRSAGLTWQTATPIFQVTTKW